MKVKKEKKLKKLTSRAKKIIILSSFCLLLLVTGGVNIYLNSLASQEANANIQTTANFFNKFRSDRVSTRASELLYLQAILDSASTSEQGKAIAEAELLRSAQTMTMIQNVEAAIMAKGFNDVVVACSTNVITVMVETSGLTKAEVAQITDAVKNNSDYKIDSIKILEV